MIIACNVISNISQSLFQVVNAEVTGREESNSRTCLVVLFAVVTTSSFLRSIISLPVFQQNMEGWFGREALSLRCRVFTMYQKARNSHVCFWHRAIRRKLRR